VTQNDDLEELKPEVIRTLCHVLRHDRFFVSRIIAADALGDMQAKSREAIQALCHAMVNDREQNVRATAALALKKIYGEKELISPLNQLLRMMSDQPKVQMNFNAPVSGVAGNVERDFNNFQTPTQELTIALNSIKKFVEEWQLKNTATTEASQAGDVLQTAEIIEAELETLQQQEPNRYQALMNGLRVAFAGGIETVKLLFPPAGIPIEIGLKLYEIWQSRQSSTEATTSDD